MNCPRCHERVYVPRADEAAITETWQGDDGPSLTDIAASRSNSDTLPGIDPKELAESLAAFEQAVGGFDPASETAASATRSSDTAATENSASQERAAESPSESLPFASPASQERFPIADDHANYDDHDDDPPSEEYVSFGEEDRRAGESEMDMTPMVDVTFLLLIFFMVTAAFSLQRSLELPSPENNEPSTQTRSMEELENDPDYVIVRVDFYNTYQVLTPDWEEEAPSKQDLLRLLRRARGEGSNPTSLMVIANGEAYHAKVVDAIDAGAEVGMNKVQLVTVEEDDE
ncbi:ExbD/TolR family protein [Lignipirellula cremea]|uniref:ExbD/TolR family protein n=1 Tax=Lignipirellula cremea TaxID=2528010 RepID=UPI0011A935BC|nr:biopolymer transporter ExbD [Lignipirellula cremea]